MSIEARIQVWKKQFEDIMIVENDYVEEDIPVLSLGPCREFSAVEVYALESIKGGKTTGPSGISANMLKAAGKDAVRILQPVANDLLMKYLT